MTIADPDHQCSAQTIELRASTELVDPRGEQTTAGGSLAPRPSDLVGGRLLLADNGKLSGDYGSLAAISDVLTSEFGTGEGAEWTHAAVDVRVLTPADLDGIAAGVARDGYTGVVVGLCDSGVTQASCIFAGALESVGVPCVLLCTRSAMPLAESYRHYARAGLPLVQLDVDQQLSSAQVARAVASAFSAIRVGLTVDPAELVRIAGEGSAADETGPIDFDTRVKTNTAKEDSGGKELEFEPGVAAARIYERLCELHMTDGLPVIPPTVPRVEVMLAHSESDPDEPLAQRLPPSGHDLTVRMAAAAAVMAGCRPEYFPIVETAIRAMADPVYRFFHTVITSHPAGNAIVVSGPLAVELGIASGSGCLGPGFRANATIGRAVNLAALNASRAIAGRTDLAPFGSPAEYSYCVAEASDRTPWTPMHAELYDDETTSVLVHRCEGPHNLLDHLSKTPEGLLDTLCSVAATLGANTAYVPAEVLVFLNPEHAHMIAGAGWSKSDVQHYIFERARNRAQDLDGRGVTRRSPAWARRLESVPIVPAPKDVIVVVAGGDGPQSMVGLPWGYARAVTLPVPRQRVK